MKKLLLASFLVFGLMFTGASYVTTHDVSADAKGQILDGVNKVNDGSTTDLGGGITKGINMLLFLIGAVSVVVIIIGGIQYVLSSGDQGKVTTAKNTILYSVVGLIVAILAYSVVNFVVTQFN